MAEQKNKTQKSTPLAVFFLTPVFIAVICSALIFITGIKPYNKFSAYINIAFSDKLKNTSSASESIIISSDINNFEKAPDAETGSTGTVVYPSFGEQYAVLSCEAIGLYVPVYWGSSSELLKNGACHLSASAVIGEKGNSVIDAHVNTFFADLDLLEEGDIIKVNTSYGEFTYQVSYQAVFEKNDKKYISQGTEDKLTLYTCIKQVLGSSTQRLAVVCVPVDSVFYN